MKEWKRRRSPWHHRVPDFKLVYCGLKESFPDKVIEFEKKKSPLLQKHGLTKNRNNQQKND